MGGLERGQEIRLATGVKGGIASGSVGISVDMGLEESGGEGWLGEFDLRGAREGRCCNCKVSK